MRPLSRVGRGASETSAEGVAELVEGVFEGPAETSCRGEAGRRDSETPGRAVSELAERLPRVCLGLLRGWWRRMPRGFEAVARGRAGAGRRVSRGLLGRLVVGGVGVVGGPLRRVVAKSVGAVCGASESWDGGGVDGSSRPRARGRVGASREVSVGPRGGRRRSVEVVCAGSVDGGGGGCRGWSGGVFPRLFSEVLSERDQVVCEGSAEGVGGWSVAVCRGWWRSSRSGPAGSLDDLSEGVERAS